MSPNEYCRQKVQKSGSSFYYSFLFLPPEKKQAIIALYALCRTWDDIADESSDQQIAMQQLAWWHSEIERLFSGEPQHPITIALKDSLSQFPLEKRLFLDLLEGMLFDVQGRQYETLSALRGYAYRVAGTVGMLCATIFGTRSPEGLAFAKSLGISLQWVNMIRDIGQDARAKRLYFPAERWTAFGVTESMIFSGKNTPELQAYLRHEAAYARQCYQEAMALLPEAERFSQCSSIIMAEIYFALLNEIEHSQFLVLDRRISLTPIKKIWIAWKTYRKEKCRHQKAKKSLSSAGAGRG